MYTFDKALPHLTYDQAIASVKAALKEQGFGVLTEIDIRATMKAKLNKDIRPYVILGACNPAMAYEALKLEPKAGAMLPCNVVVRENDQGTIEVSAIDPVASMTAIDNEALKAVAARVRQSLRDMTAAL
jgi:uncharacterized protein (DUF302 family)